MPEPVKIEELTFSLKEYATLQIELLKLEAVERVSVVGAEITGGFIVLVTVLLFVVFISLGACLYLSSILQNNYIGFFIVAGFYFLVSLILFIGRKKIVSNPIREKIINNIFSKN